MITTERDLDIVRIEAKMAELVNSFGDFVDSDGAASLSGIGGILDDTRRDRQVVVRDQK